MQSRSEKKTFKAYILLCAFLLQAIFPVGFMPAAFASGVPVQLCHSVFPMSFLDSLESSGQNKTVDHSMHHGHHGMHSSEGGNGDGQVSDHVTPEAKNQEFCAFAGLNLDDASVSSVLKLDTSQQSVIQVTQLEGLIQRQRFRLFHSRAPPPFSFV